MMRLSEELSVLENTDQEHLGANTLASLSIVLWLNAFVADAVDDVAPFIG